MKNIVKLAIVLAVVLLGVALFVFKQSPAPAKEAKAGKDFSLGAVAFENGTNGEKVLRVPVTLETEKDIVVKDVKILVYFYEKQDGKAVLTESPVTAQWLTAPITWQDAKTEEVAMGYAGPKDAGRSYYGYVVGVYYDNVLQDSSASSADLLQEYPPLALLIPSGKSEGAVGADEKAAEFSIGEMAMEDVKGGPKTLRVPVTLTAGQGISPMDLKMAVYFYEQKDGKKVLTESPIASNWLTGPVTWADRESEDILLKYAGPQEAGRTYYGYVVGVYYRGKLQASRASSPDLLNEFPLPTAMSRSGS